ncbi:MAG: polymer-forming cytoskeletal protein [Thermoanaerobaculia bacterium]
MKRVFAFALLCLAGLPAVVRAQESALLVEAGSLARRQLVAVGRDLVVYGEAQDDVAAVNGSVRVNGLVRGDVIVLGGDASVAGPGRVEGDIFVLGGRLTAEAGATIEGRSVSYPTVSGAWLVLLEGPSLGLSALSRVILGAKLALLAAWLLWSVLVMASSGRELLSASSAVSSEPLRMFLVGLGTVLSLFLTALFFSALASSVMGIPLLFLVVVVMMLFKLWGSVAVFHAAGAFVCRKLRARWSPINAAIIGLLLLGAIKLLPWVGTWVWTVVTLLGVGCAVATKFGRREPWFEPALPTAMP